MRVIEAVNPRDKGVSSKDPEVARILHGETAGPFSELEVNARELETVAARHRQIADDLCALAGRIRGGGRTI